MTQNLRDGKGSLQLSDWLTAGSGRYFLPGPRRSCGSRRNRRLDRAAGLRIATFISGYPGSPLARYDLARVRRGRAAEPTS